MKLTDQLEREARQFIDAYWANYLNGDVEAMIPLLDDDYTQVGSAESEVFSNKKDAAIQEQRLEDHPSTFFLPRSRDGGRWKPVD